MSSCTIRRVSHSEILGAHNAPSLITEYAAECSISPGEIQREMYAAMEQAGVLQCFSATLDDELIGFASVVASPMPHNGKRVATIESIFVSRARRNCNAGLLLLSAARDHARCEGCVVLTYTARIGSELDKILQHSDSCELTHTVYTEWL